MMVMTMFAALSFLVSIIAVSPSFAGQATQTTPTTKQQRAPTQTNLLPKSAFWDLEVVQCVLNGFDPCSSTINVKKGPLTGKCYYRVKTPPLNDITEADANARGTGESYAISTDLTNDLTNKQITVKIELKKLPQFTWEDVKHWKSAGQGNAPKIWTEHMDVDFGIMRQEDMGSTPFWFGVNIWYEIQEYNEENNECSGTIIINP